MIKNELRIRKKVSYRDPEKDEYLFQDNIYENPKVLGPGNLSKLLIMLSFLFQIGTLGLVSAQTGDQDSTQVVSQDMNIGGRTAFEVGTGIQGILSVFEAGLRVPLKNNSMFLNFNARYMSSLTYATFIEPNDSSVSFHPTVIGGSVAFGGCAPLIRGFLRPYGAFDLLLGYSFTPWDNYIYKCGNLIGKNLTYVLTGYFGLEVFPGPKSSIFFEAGGGFKSIHGDETNRYVTTSSWLGSGVSGRMGVRIYM
jgi:hypothetical protein